MARHARRLARGLQHGRPHSARIGGDRHEPVRDHRPAAGGGEQERHLEDVITPPSRAATTTTGTTNGANPMKLARSCFASLFLCVVAMTAMTAAARAQAQPQAPASVSPTTAELKEAASKAPPATAMQQGDPGGTINGTITDDPVSASKIGPTIGDLANLAGQNKIAINFVWTLICGFLVMFMQAGFAMVESGLPRVKNANHTYMMNFFVYGCGLLAYWLVGFAIQMGGSAGNTNLGGLQPLSVEHHWLNTSWGIFGGAGMFLA